MPHGQTLEWRLYVTLSRQPHRKEDAYRTHYFEREEHLLQVVRRAVEKLDHWRGYYQTSYEDSHQRLISKQSPTNCVYKYLAIGD
mmetsp:Transcript_79724/g.124340  ORF Transcript_79724/g.124340 Transcript_79724/m.124340 type:complete len:85 (+) Transcript_79724:235-489(+)